MKEGVFNHTLCKAELSSEVSVSIDTTSTAVFTTSVGSRSPSNSDIGLALFSRAILNGLLLCNLLLVSLVVLMVGTSFFNQVA